MRIESLSTRSVTIAIFMMVAVIAIVLSLLAGSYFRQSALDAQMDSLSRVIEVAAREMLKQVREHSYDLGMKLGHSQKIVQAARQATASGQDDPLAALLDDPFITGFVGFSHINLVKLRVFSLELAFIGESSQGLQGLEKALTPFLHEKISSRGRKDRLKAVNALWLSSKGPLFSTLVPLGGLRPVGYLEVIIDPVFNLPDIGRITQTPVSVYSMSGERIGGAVNQQAGIHLPVEYVLHTSDGVPAFRIVGLENVAKLSKEMEQTQVITITGFLALALTTLLLALWLFNRFMLSPLAVMAGNMRQMAQGKLDLAVNSKGLSEFHVLADTFNAMADQVRMRTNDLERLLDLDDSAILCFDSDQEIVFFNRAATVLFGYSNDDFGDLDMTELFTDDVPGLVRNAPGIDHRVEDKLHTLLACKYKDGRRFQCDGVINTIDVMGQTGYAIALNTVIGDEHTLSSQSEQRLEVVEQSLSSLLEFARSNPSLMLGLGNIADLSAVDLDTATDKAQLREQAVKVMHLALACWEHDLGKSKLDLAEESGLWPVYIDKSTPTTRTLDKYLNLELCPKNPRSKRVVDTAEFVLRSVGDKSSSACEQLQSELDSFRKQVSGVSRKAPKSV
ncbi:MAG: HAMP domain-containing protein [Gammaproteobacteria bacterium]|nr:HAMP domain-containing protein [Gammaproteobacteria bacterium]